MNKSSRTKKRTSADSEKNLRDDQSLVVPVEDGAQSREFPVDVASRRRRGWLVVVVLTLSFLVIGMYARVYDPHYGWTKLDGFGEMFEKNALPRLQRNPHYVGPMAGYDGQFYAQLAIDPSVQDPAFSNALDEPAYRARRIGLPAIAFCLGGAKPRRILQAYALTNLIFWFVLLGSLVFLFRPWAVRQQFCLGCGLLSFGCVTSMEHSFVDLPATAMIFAGIMLGGWGGYAAIAAAALTRETSLLAALGSLDFRRPFTTAAWRRNVGLLGLASVPIVLWMIYLRSHFGGSQTTAGYGNFGWPLQALVNRFLAGVAECLQAGLNQPAKEGGPFGWLYLDEGVHEVLSIAALFGQGLYLALRPKPTSPVWRTGVCFAVLGCALGPAVWEWTGAAARVLLPMTLCFYLLVARERDAWFWPFFVLGSLSVPYAVYEFSTFL